MPTREGGPEQWVLPGGRLGLAGNTLREGQQEVIGLLHGSDGAVLKTPTSWFQFHAPLVRPPTPRQFFLAGMPQLCSAVHPPYGAPHQKGFSHFLEYASDSQPQWLIAIGSSQSRWLPSPDNDKFQNHHGTQTWPTGPNGRPAGDFMGSTPSPLHAHHPQCMPQTSPDHEGRHHGYAYCG